MSQQPQSRVYETNYSILEKITESLNKDEIGIDDLVEKTREALSAARTCMEILNSQKGEFKKLETEFSQLLKNTPDESQPDNSNRSMIPPAGDNPGMDDPF